MMLCGCHGGYQLDGNVNVGEFDAEQDRGEPSRAKPRKRESKIGLDLGLRSITCCNQL